MIPDSRAQFKKKIQALEELIKKYHISPELVIDAILHIWKVKSFPAIAGRCPKGCTQLLEIESINDFANWLTDENNLNDAAYWLATGYAILVGKPRREAYSMYFTPPLLADRVISSLIAHGASLVDQTWHDPACGGAAFLVPVAQKMESAMRSEGFTTLDILKSIELRLSGNDIDKKLIALSRNFIWMSLYESISEAGYKPDIKISNKNGLTGRIARNKSDVIICNPPYRKLTSVEVKTSYEGKYTTIEGQPNVYGLFIEQCCNSMNEHGICGLLTPTSFLSGQYFSKLRAHLASNYIVRQLDMLSDRTSIFIGVEQETVISILNGKPPGQSVARTKINVLTEGGLFEQAGMLTLTEDARPWVIPRHKSDSKIIKTAGSSKYRLADYGYAAKIGNLVGYRDTRNRFGALPEKNTEPIYPLVWATDISPDGQFCHGRSQRDSRSKCFVQVDGKNQTGIIKKPAVLLQRLTSTDQRRRLVGAAVPKDWLETYGGFVCENHVLVLEQTGANPWPQATIAALLRSETIDRLFRSISGASNVSIYELHNLPLPDPKILKRHLNTAPNFEVAVKRAFEID